MALTTKKRWSVGELSNQAIHTGQCTEVELEMGLLLLGDGTAEGVFAMFLSSSSEIWSLADGPG